MTRSKLAREVPTVAMQASESEQVEQMTLAYCEVAIRWWEAFTGELAVRIDG